MTLFVTDNFIASNGTDLAAHSDDLGNSWAAHPATASASGTIGVPIGPQGTNQVYLDTAGTMLNDGVPDSAEYDVSVYMTFVGSQSWNGGIVGRCDPGSYTLYGVAYQEVNNRWSLYKRVNGSYLQLASWSETISANDVRHVTLRIRTNRVSVLIDDVERMWSTDTSITGPGRAGLYDSRNSTSTSGILFDQFSATTVTSTVIDSPDPRSFVYDTFTDAAGTDLTSHTGEIGATWSEHPDLASSNDEMTISSADRLYPGASSKVIASGRATTVEQTIAMTVTRMSDNDSQIAVMGWMNATSDTGYHAYVAYQASTNTSIVTLYKTTGTESSAVQLANIFYVGMPIGQPMVIALVLRPGTQIVQYNGVDIITAHDSSVPATDIVGLRGAGGSNTTGFHVDTFNAWNTGTDEGGFGGGTFVYDSFTSGSPVNLSSHVGEVGATWISHIADPGDMLIEDGAATDTDTGYIYASGVPDSAEYDVKADFAKVTNFGAVALAARMSTSAKTAYGAVVSTSSNAIFFGKYVAGAFSSFGTYNFTWTVGDPHTVRLGITNAAKKLYVDDVEVLSSTDNTITAAGRVGLLVQGINSGLTVDNFTATNLGEDTGDPYDPPAPPSGPAAPDPAEPYGTFGRTIIPYSGNRPTMTGGVIDTDVNLYRSNRANSRGLEVTSGVSGGTITLDAERAVSGTIRLDTNSPEAIPRWAWVAPVFHILRESQDPEERQVGLYRMGQPWSNGRASWAPTTIEGEDFTSILHSYTYDYAVTLGTSLDGRTLLQGICYAEGNGTTRTRIPETTKRLGYVRSWPVGTSAWELAEAVRTVMGWYPLTADDEGYLVTQPITPLADATPVRTYTPGRDSRIVSDIQIRPSDEEFANKIILTSQRPGGDKITAIAINDNPTDPNSTVHPDGPGVITRTVTDNSIEDQTVADLIAQLLLLQRGVLDVITMQVLPEIGVNLYDVIAINASNLPHLSTLTGHWQVIGRTLDIRTGKTTLKARRQANVNV